MQLLLYKNKNLYVDKQYFSKTYTELNFFDEIRKHSDVLFKMMSLDSIYNAKKNSRPKDRYASSFIKDYIDTLVDYKIDCEKRNNNVTKKLINNSVIQNIE